MDIITLTQIQAALPKLDLLPALEQGFVAYSAGKAVVPPVGELILQDPPGDVHIKYGYLPHDSYYVVKIASSFPHNTRLNLPPNNGMMQLFRQQTGELCALLLDEGYLTEVRTALAGAIAAKYLAPATVECIGIVGTGIQARFQLQALREVTTCRQVRVWGRDAQRVAQYQDEMEQEGFTFLPTSTLEKLCATCNLIVTTTTASAPLLQRAHIRQGTHITAMGADMANKQELDPAILAAADLVVADSLEQCRERGEIAHALRQHLLTPDAVVELGQVIAGTVAGRTSADQITIADLTGVAVQDIQIAKAVYEALSEKPLE
jgi:ornithine cyclodeaminase